MFSFGDFNHKEIADLIGNKDPLGLNSDTKSNVSSNTANNQQDNCINNAIPSQDEAVMPDKSNMSHNTIPHYLKAGNCKNSANTSKEEEVTPTLQVNSKSRPIRSISSGNLAKKMSFKSFEDIQQSRKRSRTNSRKTSKEIDDGNPGSSKDANFSSEPSDSEAIIQQFNDKTKEIIKTMANLHFSTIDLRNKLSQGRINNVNPIITQVTSRNYQNQGQGQVQVDIYPPAQMCWREIRGFLHKEMNLRIKSVFYDAISSNEIYPAWMIAFQPPPNLMTSTYQIETVVSLRKTQAKDMLKTLSLMSSDEAKNCKERADAVTQALKAYYQQPGASKYNLDEALNALVTLANRSQKLVHAEQQKKFLEPSHKPTLALYNGCPENFMPENIKNQRLQPFQLPPGRGVNQDPPQGGNSQT